MRACVKAGIFTLHDDLLLFDRLFDDGVEVRTPGYRMNIDLTGFQPDKSVELAEFLYFGVQAEFRGDTNLQNTGSCLPGEPVRMAMTRPAACVMDAIDNIAPALRMPARLRVALMTTTPNSTAPDRSQPRLIYQAGLLPYAISMPGQTLSEP